MAWEAEESAGVAGPVVEQRCQTTNLPWWLDSQKLSAHLHCPVRLLNDFEAIVLGIGLLQNEQLHVLQEGEGRQPGPIAVLGAGTGLGEAVAVPGLNGGLPQVLASEGGHCDFAPRTESEISLLRFLQRRHGRVSVERAVSGPGLTAIFDFIVESGQAIPHPSTLMHLNNRDPSAVIGECGLEGSDPACSKALELFVNLYGAEAGNLALKVLPTGGLYVAGGIAPKLLDALIDGRFLSALLDKGRMRTVLERMYIAIVLEPRVALQGALRQAAALEEAMTSSDRRPR